MSAAASLPVIKVHPDTQLSEVIQGLRSHWPIEGILEWMVTQASSVTLSYVGYPRKWECTWIVKERRFIGVARGIHNAVLCTLELCFEHLGNLK